MTYPPEPQYYQGGRDGAEGPHHPFSPVKERVIRRDVYALAVGSVMATLCALTAVGAYGVGHQLGGMFSAMGFVFALVGSISAGTSIMVRFRDERHKARAEREDLIRRASARRGRLETVPDATMGRGYSPASGTVIPINGRRFNPKEPLQ